MYCSLILIKFTSSK